MIEHVPVNYRSCFQAGAVDFHASMLWGCWEGYPAKAEEFGEKACPLSAFV
jgi:hypothetical protein